MRLRQGIMVVAALASASAARAEDDPLVLEPAGAWQLDMADDKCRIARLFGPADKPTLFYLEQWEPRDSADWLVAGSSVENFAPGRKTEVAFGETGWRREFEPRDMSLGSFGRAIGSLTKVVASDEDPTELRTRRGQAGYFSDEPSIEPRGFPLLDSNGAAGITTVTIRQRGKTVTLRTGDLAKPVASLNMCIENLVASWGLDVEQQRTIRQGPKFLSGNGVARQVVQKYPKKAERKGAQADFMLRLMIDQTGQVTACKLLNQTAADDFKEPKFNQEEFLCSIIRESGKFEPARDMDDKPVPSWYNIEISYIIP